MTRPPDPDAAPLALVCLVLAGLLLMYAFGLTAACGLILLAMFLKLRVD